MLCLKKLFHGWAKVSGRRRCSFFGWFLIFKLQLKALIYRIINWTMTMYCVQTTNITLQVYAELYFQQLYFGRHWPVITLNEQFNKEYHLHVYAIWSLQLLLTLANCTKTTEKPKCRNNTCYLATSQSKKTPGRHNNIPLRIFVCGVWLGSSFWIKCFFFAKICGYEFNPKIVDTGCVQE